MNDFTFTAAAAERFAALALANVRQEFPNHPQHVWLAVDDGRPPHELHPAFYGSYDWHSSVHMHWLLARVRRLHPGLPQRAAIAEVFDRHCSPAAIAGECAYFVRPHTRSFERTYGWAWLLKLADELALDDDAPTRRWSNALAPLAELIATRYRDYLPRAAHPLRYGLHANSAFGLAFALDHARRIGDPALEALLVDTATAWFVDDRDAPAAWEPSGADFLSPVLIEADLMRRVLAEDAFADWLAGFLPGLARRDPASLFTPASVSDRSDPQIVHLDGLNLSRAWCFRGIAAALPAHDPRRAIALAAARVHLAAGMAGLASGDYLGEHWLASFATLALTG